MSTDVLGGMEDALLENPVSGAFWQGIAEGRLLIQRCSKCDRAQWTPQALCSHCYAPVLHWEEASGRGVLKAWTRVWKTPDPKFRTPFILALVQLEEGPVLITRIVGDPEVDPRRGQQLRAAISGAISEGYPFERMVSAPSGEMEQLSQLRESELKA